MMRRQSFYSALMLLFLWGCGSGEIVENIGTFHAESDLFWQILSKDAYVENIGIDFEFTEGPLWHPDGYLLFSDIPANKIYKWAGLKHTIFREPSNKSNGLLTESDGTVLACEHGSRSLTSFSPEGELTVLADKYQGKLFNSPNDFCKASDGTIYFTDPPWGLPGLNDDPSKEIPFNGVFKLKDGLVTLVDGTLSWPNGIALSPDERYLYVANAENEEANGESRKKIFWVRYELDGAGNPVSRIDFFVAPDPNLPGGPDGMKVDKNGNLFLTGPGGILVVDPNGTHLGTIGIPIPASNLAFGPREKELYVTARSNVVRITLR